MPLISPLSNFPIPEIGQARRIPKPFVLVTDASEVGVGAVLLQKDGDNLWPKDEEGHFRLNDDLDPIDTWRAMEKLVLKGLFEKDAETKGKVKR